MPLAVILLYLFSEVLVSLSLANYLGVFGFFLEVVLSAVLGFAILLNFRYFFAETFLLLKSGQLSNGGFIGANVLRVVGAIFLILPGVITDILGVGMQFYALFCQRGGQNKGSSGIDIDYTIKEEK